MSSGDLHHLTRWERGLGIPGRGGGRDFSDFPFPLSLCGGPRNGERAQEKRESPRGHSEEENEERKKGEGDVSLCRARAGSGSRHGRG